MKLSLATTTLTLLSTSARAFQLSSSHTVLGRPNLTRRYILAGTESASDRVAKVFQGRPEENDAMDELVKKNFPGAISNKELETKVVKILEGKGLNPANTLLCTSLCCDELARNLEDDFNTVYGHNFNLDGVIGKVERSGIALVDSCCGSAIAASNYLKGITDGGAKITTQIQQFSDFQQGAVQELILPFGKRLGDAEDRMKELPYALYDSQDVLVRDIVNTGKGGIKKGLALLSGIQINTAPDTLDYFHPLRFDFYDENGEVVEDLLSQLS
eukprot:g13717.t1 g13717   contig9:259336-260267(+)